MKCPFCGYTRSSVIGRGQKAEEDSKWGYYRRRRQCLKCNKRFWTVERYVAEKDQLTNDLTQ